VRDARAIWLKRERSLFSLIYQQNTIGIFYDTDKTIRIWEVKLGESSLKCYLCYSSIYGGYWSSFRSHGDYEGSLRSYGSHELYLSIYGVYESSLRGCGCYLSINGDYENSLRSYGLYKNICCCYGGTLGSHGDYEDI
jgi:hypothetical protein